MSVTLEYALGITGCTLTGTAYASANGDATGVSLAFTENTTRLGYYTVTSAGLTAGENWIEISGDVIDSLFATIPASGTIKILPGQNVVQFAGQVAATGADNLPRVSVCGWMGVALTGTAANAAAAVSTFFNVVTANFTAASMNQTGDAYAYLTTNLGLLGASLSSIPKTGFKLASDGLAAITAWTVALTGNITGNLTGSVGSIPDSAGTGTLLTRLSAARAGYLDNLNVGGNLASHADVLAINVSASKHLLLQASPQMEPGETFEILLFTYSAADGSSMNADSTPTLTATGRVSGSLTVNLSAATNPATGKYSWIYTPGTTPTLEQIRFDVSATISASAFILSVMSQTVDEATVLWTATDQAHLTSVFNKLPAANIADETLVLAAIGSPMQAYTQPAGFLAATFPAGTIANTTNITAASGIGLAASQHVIVDSGTVTTVSGNVTGSVGSISGVTFPTHFSSLAISVTGIVSADAATFDGGTGWTHTTGKLWVIDGSGNAVAPASATTAIANVLPSVAFNTAGGLGASVAFNGLVASATPTTVTLQAALGKDNIVANNFINVISVAGTIQTMVVASYVDGTQVITLSSGQSWATTPSVGDKVTFSPNDNPVTDGSGAVKIQNGTLSGQIVTSGGRANANVTEIAGQTASAAGTVTFPATVASSTNITSASGVSLAASQHVIVDSGTVTTVSGNVTGSVGSISGITFPSGFSTLTISGGLLLVDVIQLNGVQVATAGSGSVTFEAGQTVAYVGSQMDLVNVPNATAITAMNSGLATPTNITAGTITTVTGVTGLTTSTIAVAVRDVNNTSPAANSLGAAVNVAGGGTIVIQNNVMVTPQVAQDALIPGQMTCLRGDTFSETLTLGTITGWVKILLTAKKHGSDLDSAAQFQIVAIAAGGGGLTILNGATAPDPTQGSLTVTDATLGTTTAVLSALVTSGFSPGKLFWDCQVEYASRVNTPQNGFFNTVMDITQATN